MTITILAPIELLKAKRMPIGTISRGRKKIAEGKWVPVKQGAKKRPTPTSPLKANVKKVEAAIANLDYEKCHAFDASGKELLVKSGQRDRIEFTNEEVTKLQGVKVFTHNHPVGGSFSPEDIQMMFLRRVGEMRVVGSKYEYSARLTGEWTTGVWNRYVNALDEADDEARDYFLPRLNAKKITIAEANLEHWHHVWTTVANKNENFQYTRKARK